MQKIEIYVQPGASKNEIAGEHDGKMKIRLQAAATEGQANKALIDFLAKHFGVKKNQIKILSGEKSRHKVIQIDS